MFIAFVAFFIAVAGATAQTSTKFNDGYLTVFKVTNGTTLANTGTAIVAEEYIFTGSSQSSPNYSVSLPTTGSTRVVVSGTATSSGAMTRSENGRFLIVPGYNAAVGDANTTFTLNAALRTINASGSIGAGVQGNGTTGFFNNTSNNLRGGTSDDGTNFWASGNGSTTNGIQTSTNGTTITNVTAALNGRVTQIYNGQLYMSLAGSLHQIGTGKSTSSSTTTTAFLTLNAGNTSIYSYAVSPDFLTIYTTDDGASKGVYRYTYSGTYSSGAYSGGTWSNTLLTSQSGTIGIAVDWTGYTGVTTAANTSNGARIFYCNPTTLNTALDNGASTVTATTLRTISGFNAFRGLAFSPIKQTVSKGTNSTSVNLVMGSSNLPVFQFNVAADEGNSTFKKIVLATSGTASIGSGNAISNFRLYHDINNNGTFESATDTLVSTGTVSGTNVTFSSINLKSYIAEGSSRDFIVIADVSSSATLGQTFTATIASNRTVNSVNYTTNITTASSSYVFIGTTAPTGNTLTIVSSAPISPTSGGNQSACTGATIPTLSASAGTGEVIDWYAGPSGGSVLSGGTGTNSYATGQTAAGTYTYYAEARNTTTTLVSATRTAVTLTITQSVTPSIIAAVDDASPALGQTINFSSTPTNGGVSPSYQWYRNNNLISGATSATYSTTSYATLDSFYVRLTSSIACLTIPTANSNSITITIDNSGCTTPPTTTAVASSANVCSGASSNLSLTNLGGASGYSFQWQTSSTQGGTYADITGATNSTFTATNITTALWYRCVVTCSAFTSSTASSAVQINVTANLTPAVSIASSASPVCIGTSVTFTATPTNGGASPSYSWYKVGNVTPVQTGSSATYASSSFTDGDQVYAVLTSNYVCVTSATANSSTVTQNITANVPASVSIASSANPSCSGASVTFTATPTNGGTPTYQWYNGASPISGATSSTYSSSALTNNASISVVMTSTITCVTGSPATSTPVVQTVSANVTPAVSIVSSNPIICNSGGTTFTATPINGGVSPIYAWYLNGSVVSGQTAATYTLSSVTNNDAVYATLTSSATCVTTSLATSSTITESVTTPQTPTVTVTSNPAAVSRVVSVQNNGSSVIFTATPTFGGAAPTYQWKLNGTNISGATSATYSTNTLANSDSISCSIVSNFACLASTTASDYLKVAIVSNSPFTPGNIIVYRSGDGASNLVNTGNAVYLDEYTQSGTFVQSTRLTKATTSASSLSIVSTGTGTSDGALTLNTNGLNVAVPGYYAYTGYASSLTGTTGTAVNRVCALVDRNQNVDTTTRLSDWASGNNARGVLANGNDIYVVGGAGGIRYAAKGATTSLQLSTTTTNLRVVNIFNGQLYVSSGSGVRVASVGTGIPTSGTTNVLTNLAGTDIPALGSPYGFFFASSTILYVADDGSKSTTIRKFQFNGINWVAAGTLALDTAARGLTGYVSGGNVTLFASTGGSSATGGMNAIYKITESLSSSNITSSYTKIVNVASANNFIAFRGICFAPTGIATQPTNKTVCIGSTTTFSVAMVTGTNAIYAYQWQTSSNSGSTWNNVANGSVYNNSTTATLTVSDPTGLNNNQYRCIVTYMGNATLTSNAATLTVPTTVTPSVSISTGVTTICSNDVASFTASGTNTGTSPIYQWKKNGNNVATGSSITFPANTLSNGDIITCVLTANNTCQTSATATSNAITMTVNQSPASATILSQYGSNTAAFTSCTLGSQVSLYPS
ncbi:MAG: hypothetical protein NTZ59_01320, partial [Bacteroidetes bacterium]|nr:hypothetical protein [Bacteroidota bacterium]